jgi:3'(2'),5'-bisphosphate nucleotidase
MARASDDRLLDAMIRIALDAGAAIMEVYARAFEVAHKADASPITAADRLAEDIILKGLAVAAPGVPVLAEESAADGRIPALGPEFFVVDPLDGTREFIDRNGEFTVNIALVRGARPALGVVYAPALARVYAGDVAQGAFRIDVGKCGQSGPCRTIRVRIPPENGLTAVASRSHRNPDTDDFLKTLRVADFAAAGSSLKFCLVAEGEADVYPRLGRTMEWDTAAGQAVLEAAGGRVVVLGSEEPLAYGKAGRGYDNPHFVAWGG